MSEIPAPYGPKKTELERLALFLNGFLSLESLESIPAPEGLQCDYDDLDDEGKERWFAFTYHELFKTAALEAAGFLGRDLAVPELGLIKRRIIIFLNKVGMEIEE